MDFFFVIIEPWEKQRRTQGGGGWRRAGAAKKILAKWEKQFIFMIKKNRMKSKLEGSASKINRKVYLYDVGCVHQAAINTNEKLLGTSIFFSY